MYIIYSFSKLATGKKAIRKWKKYECDDGNISSDDSINDSSSDNMDDETELCDYDG